MEELWIPIVFIGSIAICSALFMFLKYRNRRDMQETFRLALDKGTELSPDFIKQLSDPEPNADKDLRRGLIWLALGVAMIVLAIGIGEDDAMGPIMGSASFPGLVGVAYLVMWKLGTRKE
ncbi:MAG: DUF6249 domain-containing protein [Woeseiaceae bacterium]|nr:DUF6249 domain-containing protein [Woeseiaceae bacterium]